MYLISFGMASTALFNDLKHTVLSCIAECEKCNGGKNEDNKYVGKGKKKFKANDIRENIK